MQVTASPALRKAFLVAVVGLLFVPWTAPPVKYASAAARFQEVGPMPLRYQFEVYDAQTGDFLFAIARAVCGEGATVDSHPNNGWAFSRGEVGPTLSADEQDKLASSFEEMDSTYCDPTGYFYSAETTRHPFYIMSTAVHVPGLPDGVGIQYGRPSLLIPASAAGAPRRGELPVRVEGGPFDVHAWAGVGSRKDFCPTDASDNWWHYALDLEDDNALDPNDVFFMLCVSYRYTGDLPGQPA